MAIASQRIITVFAGYLVILRGKNFNVGDRIAIGGVRGDVVALGFMQTTIMEMVQPPGEQADAPSVWVGARQYTGRIVTVTNDKIFDHPVYNYTTEFPYIWEEMRVPVPYSADGQLVRNGRAIHRRRPARAAREGPNVTRYPGRLDAAEIQVASATFEVVGLPEIRAQIASQ